jgi:hypothetical protein
MHQESNNKALKTETLTGSVAPTATTPTMFVVAL